MGERLLAAATSGKESELLGGWFVSSVMGAHAELAAFRVRAPDADRVRGRKGGFMTLGEKETPP
jgi:hypothetical protein